MLSRRRRFITLGLIPGCTPLLILTSRSIAVSPCSTGCLYRLRFLLLAPRSLLFWGLFCATGMSLPSTGVLLSLVGSLFRPRPRRLFLPRSLSLVSRGVSSFDRRERRWRPAESSGAEHKSFNKFVMVDRVSPCWLCI